MMAHQAKMFDEVMKRKNTADPLTPADCLHETLDFIRDFNPVARLAENLHASGVTEEILINALGRRGDPISCELRNAFRDVVLGVPSTNKYGVSCRPKKLKLKKRK
jgi:hypothetical protein